MQSLANEEILDLSRWGYDNYPGLNKKYSFWEVLSFLDRNRHRTMVVKEGDRFKGVAFYLKLTDDELADILSKHKDVTDELEVSILQLSDGPHVHFTHLLTDGVKTTLKGLRQVILKERPETVSWFKPDMNKFQFIAVKEGELCHQQSRL